MEKLYLYQLYIYIMDIHKSDIKSGTVWKIACFDPKGVLVFLFYSFYSGHAQACPSNINCLVGSCDNKRLLCVLSFSNLWLYMGEMKRQTERKIWLWVGA